jgi:hypothetical protein
MKFGPVALRSAIALIAFAGLYIASASAQTMKCETGPIEKTYGSGQWFIYSCDDAKSIVAVSAPGNPAMPFYFMLSPIEGAYQLTGEGTGDKVATAGAFDHQLKKLSADDIAALIEQTRMVRDVPVR